MQPAAERAAAKATHRAIRLSRSVQPYLLGQRVHGECDCLQSHERHIHERVFVEHQPADRVPDTRDHLRQRDTGCRVREGDPVIWRHLNSMERGDQGHFSQKLFAALGNADLNNRFRLYQAFPDKFNPRGCKY